MVYFHRLETTEGVAVLLSCVTTEVGTLAYSIRFNSIFSPGSHLE